MISRLNASGGSNHTLGTRLGGRLATLSRHSPAVSNRDSSPRRTLVDRRTSSFSSSRACSACSDGPVLPPAHQLDLFEPQLHAPRGAIRRRSTRCPVPSSRIIFGGFLGTPPLTSSLNARSRTSTCRSPSKSLNKCRPTASGGSIGADADQHRRGFRRG